MKATVERADPAPPPPKRVVLDMSYEEAQQLRALVGHVGDKSAAAIKADVGRWDYSSIGLHTADDFKRVSGYVFDALLHAGVERAGRSTYR
jgi:hypothetical protein